MVYRDRQVEILHLTLAKGWYHWKKPILQISIIELLAKKGELSKSEVHHLLPKHHYPDINQAFRDLEKRKMIEFVGSDLSGPGRPERLFRITHLGLINIIKSEEYDPETFWKLLIGYCHHYPHYPEKHEKQLSAKIIRSIYDEYSREYMTYHSTNGYFLQLDQVNNMCDSWIAENLSDTLDLDGTPKLQKVLQVLALRPNISKEKLVRETSASPQEIQLLLDNYVFKPAQWSRRLGLASGKIYEDHSDSHENFLLHSLIAQDTNPKGKTGHKYRLSLFGVILTLRILRKKEINVFDRLYADVESCAMLQTYYGSITSNYSSKLPVIFGKWDCLKKYLKAFSAYNFDVIIDKATREKARGWPTIMSGNDDYYKSIEGVAHHNRSQLAQIVLDGYEIINTYKRGKEPIYFHRHSRKSKSNEFEPDEDRVRVISDLLESLSQLTDRPGTARTSKQVEGTSTTDKNLDRVKEDNGASLRILEQVLADEITFFYYLNLNHKLHITTMGYLEDWYSFQRATIDKMSGKMSLKEIKLRFPKEGSDDFSLLWYPQLGGQERLFAILKADSDIQGEFSRIIKDIVAYQKETLSLMTHFLEHDLKGESSYY